MSKELDHAVNCADNIQHQIETILLDRLLDGYTFQPGVTYEQLRVIAVLLMDRVVLNESNRDYIEGILDYIDKSKVVK